ncbi:hypothetical protein CEQ15_11330 [Chryseobacterium indologenes]|uniref:hypothetical protein n=1 Tax=Chryseobacterium indologenes TaxID=253 RepID=UPI000B51B93E|nr:hypothetical protein [Chryseobacterium indologenes]ASE62040.1 hypothetical protein CEQ15_11330 [Chryseobacterium indologenes]
MKLEEIIKAVRINTINELLGEELCDIDYEKIILYAEYTVGTDTLYRFVKLKRGLGEIIKDGDMWYERLCSLKELGFLIDHYLSMYDRKTDDVLAIDIIDHLDNPNF